MGDNKIRLLGKLITKSIDDNIIEVSDTTIDTSKEILLNVPIIEYPNAPWKRTEIKYLNLIDNYEFTKRVLYTDNSISLWKANKQGQYILNGTYSDVPTIDNNTIGMHPETSGSLTGILLVNEDSKLLDDGTKSSNMSVLNQTLIRKYTGTLNTSKIFIRSEIPGVTSIDSIEIYDESNNKISGNTINIDIGNSIQLTTIVTPTDTNDSVLWSSGNSNVTVSNTGLVTGINSCKSIKVKAYSNNNNNIYAYVNITVIVEASSITLDVDEVNLLLGGSKNIVATVLPSNTSDTDIEWSIEDDTIASITPGYDSRNATIISLTHGDTNIIATSHQNNSIYTKCLLHTIVNPTKFSLISDADGSTLSSTFSINKGIGFILYPSFSPTYTTEVTLIYTPTTTGMISISTDTSTNKTTITGLSGGSTYLNVTTSNGITSVYYITINVLMESISITPSKLTLDNISLDNIDITAVPYPSDTSDKVVVWSYPADIVTLNSTGNNLVKTVSKSYYGTGQISVMSRLGLLGYCDVTVIYYTKSISIPSIITIDSTEYSNYNLMNLITRDPVNVSNNTLKWTISDKNILSIDSNGILTGITSGTTKITLTAEDTGLTSSSTVTITVPVSIILSISGTYYINIGDSYQITYSISPIGSYSGSITWSSNDPSLTIDSTGKITSNYSGTSTIIATTSDGLYSTSCTVISVIKTTSLSITESDLIIAPNSYYTLNYSQSPDNATIKDILWTSSNESIATVSNGIISTTANYGSCVITGSNKDGGGSDTCSILNEVEITSLAFTNNYTSMVLYTSTYLQYTILPSNASNKNLTWESSDPSIISINSLTGELTSNKTGSVTITAKTTDNSNISASCKVASNINISSITPETTYEYLGVGTTYQITYTYAPSNATNSYEMNYISSNESVATVSSTGLITAVSVGSATITLYTSLDIKASISVSVAIICTGIAYSKNYIVFNKFSSYETPTIVFTPTDTTDQSLTFSSSNDSVATVNSAGTIIPISSGNDTIVLKNEDGTTIDSYTGSYATITATSSNGKSDTIIVVVSVPIDITSITLSESTKTINLNSSFELVASVLPEDATVTDPIMVWSSQYPSVVSISKVITKCTCTALATGSSLITLTDRDDTSIKSSCYVIVLSPIETLSINPSSVILHSSEPDKTLSVSYTPSTATYYEFTWSISDPTIASLTMIETSGVYVDYSNMITYNSCTISPGSLNGTATVSVYPDDITTMIGTCSVTTIIDDTSISFTESSIKIAPGTSYQLVTTQIPAEAVNSGIGVTYTSSDTNIATVDSTGLVTGIAIGTATITVKTNYMGNTSTSMITVSISVTGISMTPSDSIISIGNSTQLTSTISPSDATNTNITYTSSDTNIATVDSTGLVTGIAIGTATITVTTSDGGYTASSIIDVIEIHETTDEDLSTLLSSLSDNTTSTPYNIKITN